MQDLNYTYDPVGNITHIVDSALKTVFRNQDQVDPVSLYTYDAVYRLIEAIGREHIGQTAFEFDPPDGNFRDYHFVGHRHPNDLQALSNYTERYEYDEAGNITKMKHSFKKSTKGGWLREYFYNQESELEDGQDSNRLSSAKVSGRAKEIFSYDEHGNMLNMDHLHLMQWDFRDQLHATARLVRDDGGTPETAWYVYDAAGQRIRKVTNHLAGPNQEPKRKRERIYLGGFEIYREYGGDDETLKLERQSLHIMDDSQRIALVETRTEGSDNSPVQFIRFQLGNHLRSASLELDLKAQLISYEEYFPYGGTSYQGVRTHTETPKRYRYTGVERDEESGFGYHAARYYIPWLARWSRPIRPSLWTGRIYTFMHRTIPS